LRFFSISETHTFLFTSWVRGIGYVAVFVNTDDAPGPVIIADANEAVTAVCAFFTAVQHQAASCAVMINTGYRTRSQVRVFGVYCATGFSHDIIGDLLVTVSVLPTT